MTAGLIEKGWLFPEKDCLLTGIWLIGIWLTGIWLI